MNEKHSFWSTIPGMLTGLAAIITAIGGLLIVLFQIGFLGDADSDRIIEEEFNSKIIAPPERPLDLKLGKDSDRIKDEEFNSKDVAPPEPPLDLKFRKYLIGVWDTTHSSLYASRMTESHSIRYESDGTFSSVSTLISGNRRTTSAPVSGKWSVTTISTNKFTLTMKGENISEHQILRIIDQNTVFNENLGVNAKRTSPDG